MKITAEYVAGFFDGEGSVRIEEQKNGIFKVRCALVNTNLPVLLNIRNQFGGTLETRNVPSRPSHRQSYALCWNGTDNVLAFLSSIRPFSIVKLPEITIILDEFIPSIKGRKRTRPVPHEVINARKEMRNRVTALKHIEYAATESIQ